MGAFPVLCIIALICAAAATPLPNIGYLGAGYDIMKGNPHTTSPEQGVDPGFQAYVFNLAIYNNTVTPDNRYNVPFGVDVLLCDFCSVSSDSVTIAGSQSYQQSLSKEVNGKIGAFGFSFGGSTDFKKVSTQSSNYSDVFMETKAECCAYKAEISEYTIPPMSAEFTNAVKTLPLSYDQTAYMKLLNYFGTHAVTNMMMGGRYGMRSTFAKTGWSQITSSTIDRSTSAGASLFSFTAAAGTMTTSQKKQASDYQRFVSKNELFMVGGQLTTDGSVNSWANTAAENPMPLTITLIPLSDLFTTAYFPNMLASDLASKQNSMSTALNGYCAFLKAQGQVAQCTAPGPDPPLPLGSIFGGIYQSDDCNKDSVSNPFTGAMSCPSGFASHKIGRILAPESKCGANQYVCLLIGVTSDPLNNYGGGFQVGDMDVGNNLVNPLTNALSCPSGYSQVQTGRVAGPEIKGHGVTQYSCLTGTVPTFQSTGGFYQVTDGSNAKDDIDNPFTSAPSCPPNYCAVEYGRVLAPEAKAGAVQNVCIACNLINLL